MSKEAHFDRLTIADDPTKGEIALVRKRLDEHNLEQTGGTYHFPGNEEPGLVFDLAVRDPAGEVVGGINVSSILGVMWLEVLWVAEEHRRRGLASWLVLEGERIAHEKGCVGAGTWTFNWQGADFYPRIGYELRGVYDGYPLGMTEHVLAKCLPTSKRIRDAVSRRASRSARAGYRLVVDPTKEEMRVVGDGLEAYCVAHAGDERSNPGINIRLALRDDDGTLVGGLIASTTIRIVALEELWVDAAYRGQGLGRALVAEAERIAVQNGCIAAQGCCLSFQAPGFFHRLGYESFGTVDVYMNDHTEDLLIKRFRPEAVS